MKLYAMCKTRIENRCVCEAVGLYVDKDLGRIFSHTHEFEVSCMSQCAIERQGHLTTTPTVFHVALVENVDINIGHADVK